MSAPGELEKTIGRTTSAGGATGTIFDIQRFSIHDGPGIRTTVFFSRERVPARWHHPNADRLDMPQRFRQPAYRAAVTGRGYFIDPMLTLMMSDCASGLASLGSPIWLRPPSRAGSVTIARMSILSPAWGGKS